MKIATIRNNSTGKLSTWKVFKGAKTAYIVRDFANYHSPYGNIYSKERADELYTLVEIKKEV